MSIIRELLIMQPCLSCIQTHRGEGCQWATRSVSHLMTPRAIIILNEAAPDNHIASPCCLPLLPHRSVQACCRCTACKNSLVCATLLHKLIQKHVISRIRLAGVVHAVAANKGLELAHKLPMRSWLDLTTRGPQGKNEPRLTLCGYLVEHKFIQEYAL